ncbi:2-amino-4-hydroxy-6-hydroxymethyldihydropteridine diphosphokinase [Corynebacterium uberis]|uniref:2-amino-4-hydroxy-6- hydroxymethyldihydropteridine diphosphokinase n=1 Tax=Corynebacterium TaxID=1716 RepID=UPI001D09FB84|nr:2-amino-4-hydroxy-6-hydroxymethyldihydropteridine diphosphokinase [Corynebacterium uberis]MCZ9309761.1 2-amino-4-hydroxy-6-hydroxymethyldihydropteridine diphosphokinase [Corynebacterium sp. c6VSa_13]UDL73563.1 2-amino-4-hydroxy-6-hydroxymethyldihydropteridine diphosphokinase [Corynebacterium uberis]UDL75557.1 2-amino-4-hydroxy-6-hydroxymethyldihydropteridine diphosphokinase [Corynebacterium uberis]UDL77770.1 2-amino-4-hydroxy-6-hydroxymethyldihydropteridine diphosphokinase [Corynebacterium u
MRAVLSIGSNMEDRRALLASVPRHFGPQVRAQSQVYATPPWGVTDQPDFLNVTLIVETPDTPLELLHRGWALEQAAQRTRLRRWGPRTLDVDIVAAWDERGAEITSADPTLTLPHPQAHNRAFVLVPWLEIDPHATLGGKPVAQIVAGLDPDEVAAVRADGPLEV